MGRQGRFGKYGDIKRKERLRKGRLTVGGQKPLTGKYVPENRTLRDRIIIRDAVESDKDFIRSLSEEAFEKYGPYETTIPEWVGSGLAETFIACRRKKPLGFGMISPPHFKDPMHPASELLAIAVVRGARGRGIGHRLVLEAEKKAMEMGAVFMTLHSASGNAGARNLFKRHGFVPCRIKKSYYPKGQEAVMMKKNLT